MKIKISYLALGVMAATFVACKSENLDKGVPVDLASFRSLGEKKENDGKRFSIQGYPFISGDITVRNGIGSAKQYPYINFYDQPNGKGILIGSFPIENGSGPDQFDAPESFTMDEVTFQDHGGAKMKHTQKMSVSFTLELQTDRERTKSGDKMVYFGGPEAVRLDRAE